MSKLVKPFPSSLCHRCAAPPRYIESARQQIFILCPLHPDKYPRQPVRTCALFKAREDGDPGDAPPDTEAR